ncbi:hypothetical protein, conserved [Eimeria praecox]|uniref:Uncharacterized protein n=1 Tax=Eimeria praecox TaxID=51316 RepID=U6GZ48_9EIME|nr:hypothetical protein, conserved [Eimeria praecox]
MAHYIQDERAPACSLFDVPIIGAVSDALCCQGPKRDFATEVEFRLANAARMYPAGYTDAPSYAYGHQYMYGRSSPIHWHYKPPTAVNYSPRTAPEPAGYYPYPVQHSPQPQRWEYYYEPEHYSSPRPMAPQVELASAEPFSGCWAGALGGVPQPQVQLAGVPAHLKTAVETSHPGRTPRNEAFAVSGWKTLEVVEVQPLGEHEDVEANQKKTEDAPRGQRFESKASQTEPMMDLSRAGKDGKGSLRAPAAKRKPATAKNGQRPQAQLQQAKGDEPLRDNAIPEPNEDTIPDMSAAVPPVEAERVTGRPESKGEAKGTGDASHKEKRGDGVVTTKEDAGHRQQPSVEQNKQVTIDAASKDEQVDIQEKGETASPSEPSVAGAKRDKLADSDAHSQFQMASRKGGEAPALAFVSVEVSAPPVGSSLGPASPRSPNSSGRFVTTALGGKAELSCPTSGWPVGYVPPPDDKYKELVVGSQVYLEGGTFYLSETGAYLLGLRG